MKKKEDDRWILKRERKNKATYWLRMAHNVHSTHICDQHTCSRFPHCIFARASLNRLRDQPRFIFKGYHWLLLLTPQFRRFYKFRNDRSYLSVSPYSFMARMGTDLFLWLDKSYSTRRIMYHVWGRREDYAGFWCGNLRERDHLVDSGVDERIILRWKFRKWHMRAWTGSSWLRIGTGGRHLWLR